MPLAYEETGRARTRIANLHTDPIPRNLPVQIAHRGERLHLPRLLPVKRVITRSGTRTRHRRANNSSLTCTNQVVHDGPTEQTRSPICRNETERVGRRRQGEHDIEVFDRQQVLRLAVEPPRAGQRLALGTMAVAARIVSVVFVAAVQTVKRMPAQGRRTADRQVGQRLPLRRTVNGPAGFSAATARQWPATPRALPDPPRRWSWPHLQRAPGTKRVSLL